MAQCTNFRLQLMQLTLGVRQLVGHTGIVLVCKQRFLLFLAQNLLCRAQFTLKELDLLFVLPLILFALILG